MSVERYNARTAEIHWRQAWDAGNVFAARDDDQRPGFVLKIVPHPREGNIRPIRLGDVRGWTMADAVARYKRACNFDVLPPNGDVTAAVTTQLKSLGLSFDLNFKTAAGDPADGPPPRCSAHTSAGDLADVDPGDLVDAYGADAVRWFVLSDSPPDRDPVWTENGVLGAWRFVHRVWRLINDARKFSDGAPAVRPAAVADAALDLRKTAHRALAQVTGNIERMRFNVSIAHVYAFARALEAAIANTSGPAGPDLKFAAREAAEILVQLFHPMMPHLAEECWAALGHETLLATWNWPSPEADLLMEDSITLPVHFNGRKRADVTVARDARNGDIEASVLALAAIRRALDGKAPRKVIIVPQRIINVVA
jgi:leucyl-tRNA synthetase